MNFLGESTAFVVTAVILAAYELIKGLIARGLKTQEAVEEALWRQGLTDSLTTLIRLNEEIRRNLDVHMADERTHLSRRL
jgi:hypothetical protein